MSELIICRGIQCSGKSTWAIEYAKEKPEERVRVNKDSIRKMLGKYWVPNRENLVTHIERKTIIAAIEEGYDVVVDDTNLSKVNISVIKHLVKIANPNIKISYKDFFNVSLEECLARNKERNKTLPIDEQISDETITSMFAKYREIFNLKTK